jgi:GMP synthase (glutamine-hydrolysing)
VEPRPILILKTGCTLPELAARRGDFEDWIARGLGAAAAPLAVARVYEGEEPPAPSEVGGVVVTGSSAMVTDRAPWSERAATWLARAVSTGTPVLGICFGHQLLAHALGGCVGKNPRAPEVGTVEVRLDPGAASSDPLFSTLPSAFLAQETHFESVLETPPGSERLAVSDGDPCQAFRLGEAAWGVQFHPEFDADVTRAYLAAWREPLRAAGLDPDRIARGCIDSPEGMALLARFAALVREVEREDAP